MVNKSSKHGYILPVVVVLSLVLLTTTIILLQYITSLTSAVQSTISQTQALKAADAGLAFTANCINTNLIPEWSGPIAPRQNCSGNAVGGWNNTIATDGSWSNTYGVNYTDNPGRLTFASTGTVYIGASTTTSKTVNVDAQKQTLYNIKPSSEIAVGPSGACAIASGKAYCWGNNGNGELGTGTNISSNIPVEVKALGTPLEGKYLTNIARGEYWSCGLANSQVYCWGNNSRGNLGDGTTASSLVATVVKGIPGPVQSVQASITNANPTGGGWSGGGFTCAVSDSKGYCWGDNAAGKAGQRGGQAYLTQATQIDTSGSPLDGKVITQIAPGGAHACALAEGQVYCWGANNNKQLSNNDMGYSSTVPVLVGDGLAGKQVTAIASGTYHTCAIADGDLYCWGDWGGGKTVAQIIAAGGKKFSQLTAGHYSSCAMTNGSPYCWGQDNFGVFGNGPSGGSASPVPTDMSNMNGQFFNRVITSYYTSCGLTNTMRVYCWGANNNGWLGDGNPPSTIHDAVVYDKPTNPVVQDDRTTMKNAILTFADTNTILTSGQHHACRLANGDVYCWGKNNYGQLGDGTNINRRHLMRVTTAGTPMEGKAATSITSTENFTCAIADAKLFCWGDNGSGQFGNGSTASSSTPKAVTSLPADALVTQVSAGDSHVCAVVARTTSPSASEIYCWGNNSDGQLGNGSTGGYVVTAQKVTGIPAGAFVSKVAAKINHTCAIINGSAYCWGNNMFSLTFFGKLGGGNGATTMYSTPQPVADITNVTDIALGNDHTCAIASSKAYCWGGDFYQQLGDGWIQWPRDKPYAVSMPATATPVTSIVAGDDNTCTIAASRVYCWGRNNSGQIGNGSTGANIDTPLLIPNTGGATQITAGLIHTCATINALVSCWGDNSLGQVGDNTTINRLSPTSSINTIYMVDKSYRY